MSRHKLVVLGPIPPELRSRLSAGFQLDERMPDGGVLPGYRVAVTSTMVGASAAMMADLPDLALIACNGAGLENIDMVEAARREVKVVHTPDAVTEDTAEFAIALILSALRRVPEADRFVRAGRWSSDRMTPSRRAAGRRVGILGLGRIGSAIARRASALGMEVLYTGPNRKAHADYAYVSDLTSLAERVDVLVASCPGGSSTRNLVNARVLNQLGPDGFLVNISRGTVVDEGALIEALSSHTIAGAALDVFASEPELDRRLLSMENVVLTPHCAGATSETREAMADVLDTAIRRFVENEPALDA